MAARRTLPHLLAGRRGSLVRRVRRGAFRPHVDAVARVEALTGASLNGAPAARRDPGYAKGARPPRRSNVDPKRTFAALMLGTLGFLAACGGGGSGAGGSPTPVATVTPWPAPSNPLELAQRAGLTIEEKEFLDYHVHAHLDVFLNGDKVLVPAGIGININDPAVRHGPEPSYGGISMCSQPCISPLHTHTIDGILHTESKKSTPNKLGQFFIEWDVKLDADCVGTYCKPATPI